MRNCFSPIGAGVGLSLLAACALPDTVRAPAPAAHASVTLVAIGDIPARPIDIPAFEGVLARISADPPDVTIHIGDTKGGGAPCTDAVLERQRDYLADLAGAVVFTPGDNEWTDCHIESAGRYDPRERLAFVRSLFYPDGRSLGRQPIAVEQQSVLDPRFRTFVENARWQKNGVRFVTAHVVGSNNGLDPRDPASVVEYSARNAASTAWIREGFDLARREGAYAVVLAIHADLFKHFGVGGGLQETRRAILDGFEMFGGPVLLIHGDGHEYTVDTPFLAPDGRLLHRVVRIEVPGGADNRAVGVRIVPEAARTFEIEVFGPS